MVVQNIFKTFALLLSLTVSLTCAAFPFGSNANTSIVAQTDTNDLELGESFRLTVTLNAQSLGNQPDFDSLKQDFEILEGPSQQNIYQSTNGKSESKTIWHLTLSPKTQGALVIPPIQFKNAKTDPIVINVKKTAGGKKSRSDQIFYEASVDRDEVYVQSQLILTLRLYTEISLLDNKFGDVNIADAILKQLGDPRAFSVQRGTHNYRVAEVKFAVFPQKSGELTIPPMAFDAVVEIPGSPDQFFMFGGSDTKRVQLKTEALNINVKPTPTTYPANTPWLPAKRIELTENWSGDPNSAKVGEPLTRTLTINAAAQLASALPNIDTGKPNGYKIYPDKPQTDEKISAQGIDSIHKESLAIMPTTSGAITLPATKVYWWNTETDKLEVADLHSKTIVIEGGQTNTNASAPITPPPSPAETEQVAPTPTPPPVPAETDSSNTKLKLWQLATGLLATLWLITLMLLIRSKSQSKHIRTIEAEDPTAKVQKQIVTLKHLREQAIAACNHHQAQNARDAVIKYFAALLPAKKLHSLGDIKRQVADAGIVSCIDELESILYKDDTQNWDGNNLARALSQLKLSKVDKKLPKPILEALYPV